MHRRDSKISLLQLVRKEIDLTTRVAVDDRLGDGERLVEIAQRVEFPLLLLDGDVELPNTLQRELVLLHQDPYRIAHELRREVQDLRCHGGGEQADLNVGRQGLEDIINLILEAARQHLICLVKDKYQKVVHPQVPLPDHVKDTAGCADDEVLALSQFVDVVAHRCATDACVALDVVVVAKGQGDLLDLVCQLPGGRKDESLAGLQAVVNPLQDADGEGGRLACAGLGLADGVAPVKDRLDATLLDGTGLLETIRVDATQKVLIEVVIIERLKNRVLLRTGDGNALRRHLSGLCVGGLSDRSAERKLGTRLARLSS
mmetsp:Transcript_108445/g.221388  ORF Transcript_108445/g.221388 Transcript_108445/m.221388 type:complete len:316 (+) Transcript_108445:339-1286(+)